MTVDSWRCFVAVPIDDAIRSRLATAVAAWRAQPPADTLRWSEPRAWHLTLAFLGGVDPDDVPALSAAIGRIAARHEAVRVPTGRLGAFPRPGSARVLWYAVGDPDGAIGAIAADLAQAVRRVQDEPYHPHVTLARARGGHVDLRGWIEAASLQAPSGRLVVRSIELVRSHLSRGPARYETLASFALGGAA